MFFKCLLGLTYKGVISPVNGLHPKEIAPLTELKQCVLWGGGGGDWAGIPIKVSYTYVLLVFR